MPEQTTVNPADVIAEMACIDPEDETIKQYRNYAGEIMADQKPPEQTTFYEALPHIQDEAGEVTLAASFTPNNGIRVSLHDTESNDADWREFDFDDEQAEMIGQALIRWAHRRRYEGTR